MPVRRGLVAPRTTLIETIIRKFDTDNRSFLVANSREGQCHIIYCSDGFCRLTGYSRAEVMQRPASCEFLCGPLTSQQSVTGLREALNEGTEKHAEVLYYRKDGSSYSLTDRVLLSGIVHLTITDTLKELHVRIPSPPPTSSAKRRSSTQSKVKRKIKPSSPYLEDYFYKPPKLRRKWGRPHQGCPRNEYFGYLQELKNKTIYIYAQEPISPPKFDRSKLPQDCYTCSLIETELELINEWVFAQKIYNQLTENTLIPALHKVSVYQTCHYELPSVKESTAECSEDVADEDSEFESEIDDEKPSTNICEICGVCGADSDYDYDKQEGESEVEEETSMQEGEEELEQIAEPTCRSENFTGNTCRGKEPEITISDSGECHCKEILLKMIKEKTCQCKECVEDRRMRNAITTTIIADTTKDDEENPLKIISGVQSKTICTCMEKYLKKWERHEKWANLKRAQNDLKGLQDKFVITGVATGPDGKPVYILQGVKGKDTCACYNLQKEQEEEELRKALLPKMPEGCRRYVVSGVQSTPQGNVYILSGVTPNYECRCMEVYEKFLENHAICLMLYKAYIQKTEREKRRYFDDLSPDYDEFVPKKIEYCDSNCHCLDPPNDEAKEESSGNGSSTQQESMDKADGDISGGSSKQTANDVIICSCCGAKVRRKSSCKETEPNNDESCTCGAKSNKRSCKDETSTPCSCCGAKQTVKGSCKERNNGDVGKQKSKGDIGGCPCNRAKSATGAGSYDESVSKSCKGNSKIDNDSCPCCGASLARDLPKTSCNDSKQTANDGDCPCGGGAGSSNNKSPCGLDRTPPIRCPCGCAKSTPPDQSILCPCDLSAPSNKKSCLSQGKPNNDNDSCPCCGASLERDVPKTSCKDPKQTANDGDCSCGGGAGSSNNKSPCGLDRTPPIRCPCGCGKSSPPDQSILCPCDLSSPSNKKSCLSQGKNNAQNMPPDKNCPCSDGSKTNNEDGNYPCGSVEKKSCNDNGSNKKSPCGLDRDPPSEESTPCPCCGVPTVKFSCREDSTPECQECQLAKPDEEDDNECTCCKFARDFINFLNAETENASTDSSSMYCNCDEETSSEGSSGFNKGLNRYVILKEFPKEEEEQYELLKNALAKLAEDGFPLALLPEAHKLPHFRIWLRFRAKQCWSTEEKIVAVRKAKILCRKIDQLKPTIPCREKVDIPEEKHNWNFRSLIKRENERFRNNYFRKVKKSEIDYARVLYPITFNYEFPSKSLRDVIYTYMPAKEDDILMYKLWQKFEFRSNVRPKCK